MTAAEIAGANKAQNPTAGCKRKRTAKPDTPPPDERSSQDGEGQTPVPNGPPAKGKRAARKTKASLKKETSQIVECVMEWPDLFKSLEKAHRALNLVFTFCCTRKYLATTFDTIKA